MLKNHTGLFYKFFAGCLIMPIVLSSCSSTFGINPTLTLVLPTSPSSSSLSTETSTSTLTPTVTNTASPTTTITPTKTATIIPTATKDLLLSSETINQIVKIGRAFPAGNRFAEFAPTTQVIFQAKRTLVTEVTGDDYANEITVKDFESQQLITTLVDEQDVDYEYLIASPDSRLLAAVSPTAEKIIVWDMEALQKVAALNFRGVISQYTLPNVVHLTGSFSFDNRWLAVSGCILIGTPDSENFCRAVKTFIYEIETRTTIQELNNNQTDVFDTAFSPDNRLLALAGTGSQGGSLLIWDLLKAEFVTEIVDGDVFTSLFFSPTGDTLIAFNIISVAYSPNTLQLWDTADWMLVAKYEASWSTCCIRFIPNTDMIAMSYLGLDGVGAVFFELETQQSYRVEALIGQVIEIFASPDQRYLYILTEHVGLEKWGIP